MKKATKSTTARNIEDEIQTKKKKWLVDDYSIILQQQIIVTYIMKRHTKYFILGRTDRHYQYF